MFMSRGREYCANRSVLHTAALILLACALFAAYSNSFQAGFTRDSTAIILEDPRLRTVSRENLRLIFQENYWWPTAEGGLYRPLATLSYMVNYAVLNNEDRPGGYHWINFLLHSCNACLVYWLAFRLMRRTLPALFMAALWALHPVCTEAVANIVGRDEELAAMAVLACLLLYIRSASVLGWRRIAGLFATMLAAAAGVLSKENAVVVAALLPLYDLTYRIVRRQMSPVRNLISNFAQYITHGYIALAPPLLALVYAHFAMLRKPSPVTWSFVDNPILAAGFWTGRLTALKVVGKYFWLLIWPQNLSCDYSFNSIPLVNWPFRSWEDWQAAAALGAVAAMLLLAGVCYQRNRTVFFLIGFSALALLPTANLVAPIGSIMAERFLYLPAIGFAGCAVLAAYFFCERLRLPASAPAVILSVIAIAFGTRTYLRNADWSSNETLWAQAVKTAPHSFKPHIALADIWFSENGPWRIRPVLNEAEKAANILADLPDNRNTVIVFQKLGAYYLAKGDTVARRERDGSLIATPESRAWYLKALPVLQRGIAIDQKSYVAIHKKPNLPALGWEPLYATVGQAYLRLGKPEQAMDGFLYQRRISPGNPAVYKSLASANLMAGKREDAIIALLESLIVDKSGSAMPAILRLYDELHPQSCATYIHDNKEFLNSTCAVVQRHTCMAFGDLVKAYRDGNRAEDAERVRSSARQQYNCGTDAPLVSSR